MLFNFFSILHLSECNTGNGIDYYDCTLKNGPISWKHKYPSANGNFQSPINIISVETSLLLIYEPLIWNYYDEIPTEIFIRNSGYTVELKANFSCNVPTISGADLLENYKFLNLCFRWSILDDQGSEHSINNKKYPVELQITKNDNPCLDPIILNLRKIRGPGIWVQIPSFPLSWLCYNFQTNFYSYGGSLTEPPCCEGVTWFIFPEPMAISIKQLSEFRTLQSRTLNKILNNSRPIQNLNSRIVCLNRYIGYDEETEDEDVPAICD
ncbi:carbonic anhydrase 1-like isoform X2 [Condylostylus longicornis]|uniref:carbonic anhydrase 1-like isoform X2 n=1 Tax=Condylostylus longicornis TaxID=2530218 RepID=UPI00244E2430|nr:carbonic anhydrase 1-like isoform X2 [Condylostylus longicornis]